MPCSVRFKVATSGKYQESVRFLESTRKVSGKCRESVRKVSGKCRGKRRLPNIKWAYVSLTVLPFFLTLLGLGYLAADSWLPHRFRDEASSLAVVTAHGGFGIRFSLYFSDVTSAPPS